MRLDWLDVLSLFTIIQLIVLAAVILNSQKGNRRSNLFLAGFMASNAILIASFLLNRYGLLAPQRWLLVYSIGGASYFLLMPFLYLYILSLCYNDIRMTTGRWLHFILFLLYTAAVFVAAATKTTIARTEPFPSVPQIVQFLEYRTHRPVLHLQIFLYLVASAAVLRKYRIRLKDMYSSIERIDLVWCNFLLVTFALMWSMDVLHWILDAIHQNTAAASAVTITASLCINLVFTLLATYKGLAQSTSFSGIQKQQKYGRARLDETERMTIIRNLKIVLEQHKPHLSPDLSLDDLAGQLKVSTKSLSQAMHTELQQNFYDTINACRIKEIQRRMTDHRYKNFTLLSIALECGFNSKSVFNTAFKKHTGVTPKEYRRQLSA